MGWSCMYYIRTQVYPADRSGLQIQMGAQVYLSRKGLQRMVRMGALVYLAGRFGLQVWMGA